MTTAELHEILDDENRKLTSDELKEAEYIEREAFKRKLIDEKSFFPAIVERALEEMPTADVVPKSEVEMLKRAYEGSQKTIKGLTEMIREKNKELAKLETHLELHHGERSLNNLIAEEKAEVAREIFEEIERFLYMHFRFCKEEIGNDDAEYLKGRLELNTQIQNFIAELKKKYI